MSQTDGYCMGSQQHSGMAAWDAGEVRNLPFKVDLNLNEAIASSQSSLLNTATISSQDFPVFTTDSQQSSWLPSSSQSQPAQPEQPAFFPPQQDFVLFEQTPPPPQRQNANRTVSSPASHAAAFGSLNVNPSKSPQLLNGSPTVQNQRIARIIQATGHQTSSTAYTNRFNSQPQLYTSASLSPSSPNQQNRLVRPPVPLFTHGTGTQRVQPNMDFQGNFSESAQSTFPISHQADALNGFEEHTFYRGGTTAFSSPGIPGYDANMSSTPSSVGNLATVSPFELHIDPTSSAPNSAAITNLTSPSLPSESPDFLDSYEASPNIGANELDSSNWFPLFNDAQIDNTAFNVDDYSPVNESESVEETETVSRPRMKSGGSPLTRTHGKHSSVSDGGVVKPKKPLPAIQVDDHHDVVAMKRARNTLAARKSRARKAERFEALELQIAKLKEERDYWKNRCEDMSNGG
ncbi:hypothetical protein F4781DRAFT_443917 [Annulohypoxylon bovei var. microspora]|nr:hypothetical protein F4781DRAFT_443917 [Annulohypoxylon bovei var. microspora]